MFDTNRNIDITLQYGGAAKTVTVRFPTDEEWSEYQSRIKVVIKRLDHGRSETILPDSTAPAAALLKKIQIGEQPEIDAYEATRVIEQISRVEVDDVTPDGVGFIVTLRVPGGPTTHNVRTPTAKEENRYRNRRARTIDLPYNRHEVSIILSAAAELYDQIKESVDGYAGDVPIIHKAQVARAVIEAIDSGMGAADENF